MVLDCKTSLPERSFETAEAANWLQSWIGDGAAVRRERGAPARDRRVRRLVERFDIEPYSDFSAK